MIDALLYKVADDRKSTDGIAADHSLRVKLYSGNGKRFMLKSFYHITMRGSDPKSLAQILHSLMVVAVDNELLAVELLSY